MKFRNIFKKKKKIPLTIEQLEYLDRHIIYDKIAELYFKDKTLEDIKDELQKNL